jgi:hypothetical protein
LSSSQTNPLLDEEFSSSTVFFAISASSIMKKAGKFLFEIGLAIMVKCLDSISKQEE